MDRHPGRHRIENQARADPLAVAQLHGIFPRDRVLPEYSGRDVLGRVHSARVQLAMFARLHGAGDHRDGLDV